ncbi:P-loop containing nucleoside triphosphate hydrolase protein [Lasiosphaeria hispida]|uniref:P-loop containing nucleoside triphosphate hydrolase protein n=1 Tax=Lasiosphaeria hispida TaxID=260671 RepID=A0AAJ0H7M3_9PEZI|nr:P-loop containing nucleoside triphosphate hydrolase protein [Lasiosphaeria hispida]
MSGLLQRVAVVEGLNSVDRIVEYGNVPTEPTSGANPEPTWPAHGQVKVRNLVAGYREGLSPDLRDISFSVSPGERGVILIDGVDISTIKVHALRRQIFTIAQDPYLFSGSLRSTLDPDGVMDDETLKSALERGGTNISQGQRQVLCLARALLYRRKVIIMDEATSAVDVETDAAIQAALQEGLPDSTMIVVAHRLATVAGFDKILVLEDGAVAEFGTPADLYQQKGAFWKLVSHTEGF